MQRDRIKTLDGFRCLAILGVIFYHYFVLFAKPFSQDYYPYHNTYSNIPLFQYGYLGVHFFFMISGFVIYMTLDKSKNIKEFAIKRFIRLWPTLLIISIINLIVLFFSPFKELIPTFKDLLPTLTITEPRIWWRLFDVDVKFVDGVEWTLVVEVYFYIVSSVIFFINKEKFFRNWVLYNTLILLLQFSITLFKIPRLSNYTTWLLFPGYVSLFSMGMYFYILYMRQKLNLFIHITAVCLIITQLIFLQKPGELPFILSFIMLFLMFIYRASWLAFLSNRIFVKIGVCSYSIYLFHNNIGVVLIHYFSKLFNSSALYLTVLPTVFIIGGTCLSVEIFVRKVSNPFLNKTFIKKV
jgi:peptidoglycan/LPS O-acetylase OafA/YrhL